MKIHLLCGISALGVGGKLQTPNLSIEVDK
jgi:hypothetical protein